MFGEGKHEELPSYSALQFDHLIPLYLVTLDLCIVTCRAIDAGYRDLIYLPKGAFITVTSFICELMASAVMLWPFGSSSMFQINLE